MSGRTGWEVLPVWWDARVMRRRLDPFLDRWDSLTEPQRRFLLAAYEMDSQLPHSDGWHLLLPKLKWRTVGVMCGLRAPESDAVVRTLSELGLVLVHDAGQQEMRLVSRHEVGAVIEARRRRWWDRVILAAAVLTVISAWLTRS